MLVVVTVACGYGDGAPDGFVGGGVRVSRAGPGGGLGCTCRSGSRAGRGCRSGGGPSGRLPTGSTTRDGAGCRCSAACGRCQGLGPGAVGCRLGRCVPGALLGGGAATLRTVDTGRSMMAAVRRCPSPFALCSNAVPITAVVSACRGCNAAGITMCVAEHDRHRVRRGRAVTVVPSRSRTVRCWPCPQATSWPVRQRGQRSSPWVSSCSASVVVRATITVEPVHDASALPTTFGLV